MISSHCNIEHHGARRALLLTLLLLLVDPRVGVAQGSRVFDVVPDVSRGSLLDIKDKRRVLLVANKSLLVDGRGSAQGVLNEIYKNSGRPSTPHYRAYRAIALKINKYIKKHQSLSAVERVADADFIIVFKVLFERRPGLFQGITAGEMFVIMNPTSPTEQPRIVWQTKNNRQTVEDATNDFLKALKRVRGEK